MKISITFIAQIECPKAAYLSSPKAYNSVSAAVLADGTRVLTQATVLRALGRSRSPKAGTGVLSTVDQLPFFLQAEGLKPYITEDLKASTKPIFYRTRTGKRAVGYDAEILPRVCEVYLRLRDDYLAKPGGVPKRYEHIVHACDVLIRGLAHTGIIALVDEATGYQEVRDRHALQEVLNSDGGEGFGPCLVAGRDHWALVTVASTR